MIKTKIIQIIDLLIMKNMRFLVLLVFLAFLLLRGESVTVNSTCHYSCSACTASDYYRCTGCNINRGSSGLPVFGMCYCSDSRDQDSTGVCTSSNDYNYTSKVLIIVFISLTLVLSIIVLLIKGMKYFLFKTIEDVQELSLIVFINLYFPQQFDIFNTSLYRFNISSYTFENMALGSLFSVQPDYSVSSVDGQNIFGKYRLLIKTANFFSNQFTWIIVTFAILVFAIVVRIVRNCLKKREEEEIFKQEIIKKQHRQTTTENLDENYEGFFSETDEVVRIKKKKASQEGSTAYKVFNRLYNILWLNLLIAYFYFSIIEININIFTQVGNLTFSSPFATTGAFFSAVFLALQIVLLFLLFLKAKQQMIKPEWMRDYAYTPTIYLVRTNYKTITKYFWFISVIKKVLLAMMITLLYDDPLSSIIGVSTVHAIYLVLAIYCEPFERKYIRVHFYMTEGLKMFMFLCLVDFTTKYVQFIELIGLTQIFYAMLAFIFGSHLLFLLVNIVSERRVYWHFLKKRCFRESYEQEGMEAVRVGYRSNDKLFIYAKE